MALRCAAYARYSSDLQSPLSIEDQLRICREYAKSRGFVFLEEHVYVDEAWVAKLPAPMSDEGDMLGDLTSRRENSRLSCQIVLNDTLSGLKVQIAPEE